MLSNFQSACLQLLHYREHPEGCTDYNSPKEHHVQQEQAVRIGPMLHVLYLLTTSFLSPNPASQKELPVHRSSRVCSTEKLDIMDLGMASFAPGLSQA